MKVARVALLVIGAALGIVAYRVQVQNLAASTPARAAAQVGAGWCFLAAGLIAWSRRPGNRMGPLMIATCFALLFRQLRYAHDEFFFTTFFALGELAYALFIHTVLAYPSGRLTDRLERAFVAVAYAVAIVFPFAILLFDDGSQQLRYFYSQQQQPSYLLVHGDAQVVKLLQDAYAVIGYGVVASVFILLIVRKLVRATPRARRILAPLLLAAAVAAPRAVFDSVLTFAHEPPAFVKDNLFWWQIIGIAAIPIALLAGLLRARLSRASVGDLVVRLERTPPQGIRDELARALGDPSLEVAFWIPDRKEFVDSDGRPVPLPDEGSTRAVTMLEHDGEPVAVLLHDPSLQDEPKLVEAAAAAARLSLENARLHAELLAQLEKVKESRARIVAAGDEQRRRIERDIHDGLQQRLVAIALEARAAQRRLGERADPEVEQALANLAAESQVAVEELRELARGIHPAILTEGGLAAALESLSRRSPLPVQVHATRERFAAEIEAAAYFVACEALVNVFKHAQASSATIGAQRTNGTLIVDVADDGVGGARANDGSGLRGLADRVEAYGGLMRIESPPGGGTRIVAEIPCAS